MLTLYYSPNACSMASHVMLEEIGAPFEAKRVNFGAEQQKSAEYLALNPKARVPTLATDRGIITETPAILAYLAQTFPEKKLAPLDDPFAFAELQAVTSYFCSTVHVAHAHKGRGPRWAYEESSFADMKRKVPESMTAAFELIESKLLKGPWVMGESFTIADPYLFILTRWAEGDGVDLSRLTKVSDHYARMNARPAVKAVIAREAAA